MDARKRWSSFGDREKWGYNGRENFKFPRTTASASDSYYNENYNETYDQHYNETYEQIHDEQPKENYSEPGAYGYNSQAFPKDPPVQQGQPPWKQNRAEGVCCCPAHEGNMCTTLAAALPGLLGAGGGQGGLMMKPFQQFPVKNNTAAPPGPPFFQNFNKMDPVQKAVFKHTFGGRGGGRGMAKVKRRKQPVKCVVCRLEFNSDSQAQAHFRGSRHAKKLKMQQISKMPLNLPAKSGTKEAEQAEQAKNSLYCSICKVAVNSLMQLDAHNSGAKHKTMLDSRNSSASDKAPPADDAKVKSGPGAPVAAEGTAAAEGAAATAGAGAVAIAEPAAPPPPKGSGLQIKSFHCQTCNIHVNSETQLNQHISSKRHKDRVAGRPPKPRFNKSQHMPIPRPDRSELDSAPPSSPPTEATNAGNLPASPTGLSTHLCSGGLRLAGMAPA